MGSNAEIDIVKYLEEEEDFILPSDFFHTPLRDSVACNVYDNVICPASPDALVARSDDNGVYQSFVETSVAMDTGRPVVSALPNEELLLDQSYCTVMLESSDDGGRCAGVGSSSESGSPPSQRPLQSDSTLKILLQAVAAKDSDDKLRRTMALAARLQEIDTAKKRMQLLLRKQKLQQAVAGVSEPGLVPATHGDRQHRQVKLVLQPPAAGLAVPAAPTTVDSPAYSAQQFRPVCVVNSQPSMVTCERSSERKAVGQIDLRTLQKVSVERLPGVEQSVCCLELSE